MPLPFLAAIRRVAFSLMLLGMGCAPREDTPPPAPAQAPETGATTNDEFEFETAELAAPGKLSDLGLFDDLPGQKPAAGVIPYALQVEAFADHATVRRFLRMPPGGVAQYREEGAFEFPVGTILAQTFSYWRDANNPDAGEQHVETRVLLRQAGGWDALAYLWNKEGSDARRALAGGIVEVTMTESGGALQSVKCIVMNKNDCKRCHEFNGAMQVIGATAANLNVDAPGAPERAQQLARWTDSSWLSGTPAAPAQIPRLPRWNHVEDGSIADRARAWLDVNCAHCHNPGGAGGVSGLDLRRSQNNPLRYGIFKPPVAAGRGSEGHRYSIEPGYPDRSFLVSRLLSVDPSVMMPPVGRRQSCSEAAALISDWIAGMQYSPGESDELIERQRALHEQLQREAADHAPGN